MLDRVILEEDKLQVLEERMNKKYWTPERSTQSAI
jgi:hypothetical protein